MIRASYIIYHNDISFKYIQRVLMDCFISFILGAIYIHVNNMSLTQVEYHF